MKEQTVVRLRHVDTHHRPRCVPGAAGLTELTVATLMDVEEEEQQSLFVVCMNPGDSYVLHL